MVTFSKEISKENQMNDNGNSVCVLQEIVDWFNSIRAVQLHYLKVAFPGATDAEVCSQRHFFFFSIQKSFLL